MSATVKYLSQEWCNEAGRLLAAEITPEKMNRISSSMSNIYRNCPGGKDRFFHVKFVDGVISVISVGEGTPPEAEFVITGDYEVFAKISRAELGAQKALMTGKLKLKGNMVKALKLASVVDRLNKVIAKIQAEY
jgi:putative sterol carrier protein